MSISLKGLYFNFFPKVEIKMFSPNEYLKPENRLNGKEVIILIFGNSINEIGPENSLEYLKVIDPHFIFTLGPGTKDSFQRLMRFRKLVEVNKGEILYPCISESKGCPLENSNDWCHQVVRVKHDAAHRQISQIAKIDHRSLPFVFHFYRFRGLSVFYSKPDGLLSKPKGRLLQFLGKNKASFRWRVCIEGETQHYLVEVEILRRFLSGDLKNRVELFQAGDLIEFNISQRISENIFRITL